MSKFEYIHVTCLQWFTL